MRKDLYKGIKLAKKDHFNLIYLDFFLLRQIEKGNNEINS